MNNTIPNDAINNLKCTFCTRSLAIPPIFGSEDGKINICGRCKPSEGGAWMRNAVYEEVASKLKYNCSISNNCKDILVWNNVFEHETVNCSFKPIQCPACPTKYEMQSIKPHFEENHKDIIIICDQQDSLFVTPDIKVNTPWNSLNLLKIGADLFLLCIQSDDIQVDISINILNSSLIDKYFYKVKFSNNCSGKYVSYKNQKIMMFNEKSPITKQLSVKWNVLTDSVPLVEMEKESVTITFSIFDKSNSNFIKQLSEVKKVLGEYIECPVCYNEMSRPIYQCHSGHSLCQTCVLKVHKTCPTCQSNFQGCRNFALEKLVKRLKDNENIKLSSKPIQLKFNPKVKHPKASGLFRF